jgi:prevent-host-death family protein
VSETSVGIRELKSRLSEYLRRVKAGETMIITDRGQPVGRIVPVEQPLNERLQAMAQAGLILWSGRKLGPMVPVARVRGTHTVAELLVEGRER